MLDQDIRPRPTWCYALVAATLVLTGCSAGVGDQSPSSAPTTAASSQLPSTTASPAPSSSSVAPSSDPSATAAPVQTLASKTFTVNGSMTRTPVRMRFDVVELKRRGDLLDLTASLTNLEQSRERDLRWQVGSRFGGPYREDIKAGDAFSGAVLTDLAGKKRYLVAADSGDQCVCTVQLSSTFVDAGQSVELTATYAAPPASTTKLDVSVASLGTFRDLPVS